jgi:hypothetical protein
MFFGRTGQNPTQDNSKSKLICQVTNPTKVKVCYF